MFIRWTRRSRQTTCHDKENGRQTALICALLVRSERIDKKPRQKIVAYLGSIREYHIDDQNATVRRLDFWNTAREALDALQLKKAERKAIESALRKRVPRPTEKEIEDARRRWKAFNAAFRKGSP